MEDGGAELLSERMRHKLFWVDINQVSLFYSWMRTFHGRLFEETVHTMYKWCGIPPLYPSLVHEFQYFAMASTGPRIAVNKVRYDIWEVVASELFGFYGASFVAWALDLCRFQEPGSYSWEPLKAAARKSAEANIFFWNRPDLDYLVAQLLRIVTIQDAPNPSSLQDAVDELQARVWTFLLHFKGLSKSQLELDHPWNVFDVTELVCQLYYTWLLATKRVDVLSGSGSDLSPEMLNLSLSLLFNSNSVTHVKPITSECLQQLENWVKLRMSLVYQGESIFSLTRTFPVTLIQKLITEVKVPDIAVDRSPPVTTGWRFDTLVKVDLHSSVVELDFEAVSDMSRLFASWLRCPGGVSKHRLIVQQMDEAYSRMGWPKCKNSSLVEEIRSTLSSRKLSQEQAQARYNVWLESFRIPEGIEKMKGERNFVNLVAAVSMHMEEEYEEPSWEPSWELVEKARYHATAGGHYILKPLLVRADDKREDADVNEVILYIVEELCYWKRFELDMGEDDFDSEFMSYPLMDHLRAARLPDVTKEGVERQLKRTTIALCRDVTEPVLRIVSSWQKKHGSGREVEESKSWKSLEYCLYLRGGAGWTPEATQDDFEVYQRAGASDDLNKVVALFTGGCNVKPLVHRLLEDLRAKPSVMSGEPSKKLCDAVSKISLVE